MKNGARISAARARDSHLVLSAYCENQECAVRTIELRIKDYEGTVIKKMRQHFQCPVCGSNKLTIHSVFTFDEQEAEEALDARRSIIVQMYKRDWSLCPKNAGRFVMYPASIFVSFQHLRDDWLPPTPPGFWSKHELKCLGLDESQSSGDAQPKHHHPSFEDWSSLQ